MIKIRLLGTPYSFKYPEGNFIPKNVLKELYFFVQKNFTKKILLQDLHHQFQKVFDSLQIYKILDGIANYDWSFYLDELIYLAGKKGIPEITVREWLEKSGYFETKYGICLKYGKKAKRISLTPPIQVYIT